MFAPWLSYLWAIYNIARILTTILQKYPTSDPFLDQIFAETRVAYSLVTSPPLQTVPKERTLSMLMRVIVLCVFWALFWPQKPVHWTGFWGEVGGWRRFSSLSDWIFYPTDQTYQWVWTSSVLHEPLKVNLYQELSHRLKVAIHWSTVPTGCFHTKSTIKQQS